MPKKIQIRKKAQTYGKKGKFKGSKGWCDKFVVRNEDKIKNWLILAKNTSNVSDLKSKTPKQGKS